MTEYTRKEALATGLPTFVLGPSQVSYTDVPGRPDEAYLINWITDRRKRGRGFGRALMVCVLHAADVTGFTLVTHPANDEIRGIFERYGFEVADSPLMDGQPLLLRPPQRPGPAPCGQDRLLLVNG